MNKKNDVEVVINGKQYTLSGYESSNYLQKIASHINDKFAELKEEEGFLHLDTEMRNILLAINLSDDYQKAVRAIEDVRGECAEIEKEMFDMKHQMISLMKTLEDVQKENESLKTELEETKHQVIRYEAELDRKASEQQAEENSVSALKVDTVGGDYAEPKAVDMQVEENGESQASEEAGKVTEPGTAQQSEQGQGKVQEFHSGAKSRRNNRSKKKR